MSDFDGKYAVAAHGSQVGTALVYTEGLMTVVECECALVPDEILRLGAVCGGRAVPLGVLMPREGGLYLKKRFSAAALRGMGLSAPSAFVIVGAQGPASEQEPEPEPEPEPEQTAEPEPEPETETEQEPEQAAEPPFPPPPWETDDGTLLPREYRGIRGALVSRAGGDVRLAVPLNDGPFPAMPVFMFGEPVTIGGSDYVAFRFRGGEIV